MTKRLIASSVIALSLPLNTTPWADSSTSQPRALVNPKSNELNSKL